MVARALLIRPRLIIADEPVLMVDASLRATILGSLRELNRAFGISLIYITHDLTTAYQISENIVVLYRGSVAEVGDVEKVVGDPKHPYTRLLVGSVPLPDPVRATLGDAGLEEARQVALSRRAVARRLLEERLGLHEPALRPQEAAEPEARFERGRVHGQDVLEGPDRPFARGARVRRAALGGLQVGGAVERGRQGEEDARVGRLGLARGLAFRPGDLGEADRERRLGRRGVERGAPEPGIQLPLLREPVLPRAAGRRLLRPAREVAGGGQLDPSRRLVRLLQGLDPRLEVQEGDGLDHAEVDLVGRRGARAQHALARAKPALRVADLGARPAEHRVHDRAAPAPVRHAEAEIRRDVVRPPFSGDGRREQEGQEQHRVAGVSAP